MEIWYDEKGNVTTRQMSPDEAQKRGLHRGYANRVKIIMTRNGYAGCNVAIRNTDGKIVRIMGANAARMSGL